MTSLNNNSTNDYLSKLILESFNSEMGKLHGQKLSFKEIYDYCSTNYPYPENYLKTIINKLVNNGKIIKENNEFVLFDDKVDYYNKYKEDILVLSSKYLSLAEDNKIKDKTKLKKLINKINKIIESET